MDHDDGDSRDGGKDEWERLGLDKRIDFENLRRVFERLDLKVNIPPGKLSKCFCIRASWLALLLPLDSFHLLRPSQAYSQHPENNQGCQMLSAR